MRMLVKYPGLTLVGGLAMAFAIAIGAASFEFVTQLVHPTLPLDEGDRIVGIENWDAASSSVGSAGARTTSLAWRDELESVEDLGAFRTLERNLIILRRRAEPVEVAEISASAFRVARVPAAARPRAGRRATSRPRRRRSSSSGTTCGRRASPAIPPWSGGPCGSGARRAPWSA